MIGRHVAMSTTSAIGVPGLLHRVDVGHVGHRATGVEVRQDDLLMRPRSGCRPTRP